jgi:hypothetical protein
MYHLEAARITADWLSGVTLDYQAVVQGVNAQLDKLTSDDLLDGSDAQPDDVVFFGDQTRDDVVARNARPVSYPAIYVQPVYPADADGEVRSAPVRDARGVGVAVRVFLKDADTPRGVQAALYMLRAIVRSIRELARESNFAQRTRNSICLKTVEKITVGPSHDNDGTTGCFGVVIAEWECRDLKP